MHQGIAKAFHPGKVFHQLAPARIQRFVDPEYMGIAYGQHHGFSEGEALLRQQRIEPFQGDSGVETLSLIHI